MSGIRFGGSDTARAVAVRIIDETLENKGRANVLLRQALAEVTMSAKDKALATELVYGTLRNVYRLDWVLSAFVDRPLDRLTPMVRDILRVASYQIMFLDRIPSHAAVNEAVELTRQSGHGRAAGFVNGVLRNALRDERRLAALPPEKPLDRYLSIQYSHPRWLVRRWLERYGPESTEALCCANNEPMQVTLRANTLKTSEDALRRTLEQEGVEAKGSDYVPEGTVVLSAVDLQGLPSYREGLFQIQGESAMLVSRILAPEPGDFVIDACAAPGGKTTHIAALMRNRGQVCAVDLDPDRLETVVENSERLGASIVEARSFDARLLHRAFRDEADRVLVDAPCTGLGLVRRRPDIRYHKTAEDISSLKEIQLDILLSAGRCVKPGGVLVYSTCTLTEEENQLVVEEFLKANSQFGLSDINPFIPQVFSDSNGGPMGQLELLPHIHNVDGFFIARFERLR